jgi:hypothetical protein
VSLSLIANFQNLINPDEKPTCTAIYIFRYFQPPSTKRLGKSSHYSSATKRKLMPPLTPFENIEEALEGNREANAFYQSLNGTWKFKWVSTVAEVSKDFYLDESKVSAWDDIEVPSNWQMTGYGHPMFRNVTMEFPEKAPMVS